MTTVKSKVCQWNLNYYILSPKSTSGVYMTIKIVSLRSTIGILMAIGTDWVNICKPEVYQWYLDD